MTWCPWCQEDDKTDNLLCKSCLDFMLNTIEETNKTVDTTPKKRKPYAIKCNYCLHVMMAEE